jgi:hypothetical protein
METDFAALDALYPLPPEELSRQWLVARDAAVLPPRWQRRTLAGLHFAAHPDAHVCALHARDGAPLGWLLEPLAYLQRDRDTAPEGSLTLPVGPDAGAAEIEAALYGRGADGWTEGDGLEGGNWVAIVAGSGAAPLRRVYQGGGHSIVYSPAAGIAATSHNLIPDVRRDEALSRAVDPLARNGFYGFGLTAFRGVRRLLPNHYLDLDAVRAVRHWPREGFEPRIAGEAGAAAMVDHARRVLRALAERYPNFLVPLSAGRDSRAVLACLRPFAGNPPPQLHLFTSVRADRGSVIDGQIAVRLARIAGLQHEIRRIRRHATEPADVRRAFVLIGEAKSGSILAAPGRESREPLPGQLALPGMTGETARAYYWPRMRAEPELTPASLARHVGMPAIDPVVEAAAQWLDGLPPGVRDDRADILALAHVEQKVGCWDATTRYLFPGPNRANMSLMGTNLGLQTMLRLPVDYRAQGLLQQDMIAYGWPELLRLPFNEPVGWLRLRQQAEELQDRAWRRLARMVPRPAA